MNILNSIMSKIFPNNPAFAQQKSAQSQVAPGTGPVAAPTAQSAAVDIDAILTKMASGQGQKLNWQSSIVDLLKLLDLDSSLKARKELAKELDYNGDMNDSSAMNIWLHAQVMRRFAENGGKIPESLKH